MATGPDSMIGLYRRDITDPERLKQTTVGRNHLIEELLEELANNARDGRSQHYVVTGPRGIGKTHLLTRLVQGIQESKTLSDLYIPIRFPEENHRILSFADLLLGMLELLAEELGSRDFMARYESLALVDDNNHVVEAIMPIFRRFAKEENKRLLILLENMDALLTVQIKNRQDIHALRSFLMDEEFAVLIGTSPTLFPGLISVRHPLYDFFQILSLDKLDEQQTIELICRNLEWDQRDELLAQMDSLKPKLHALYLMTSGNPRLILLLYQLISYDNILEVKQKFEGLLDQVTPFYQDRTKELPAQERAVLETLALMRVPRTPANIARRLRMSASQTSSLLGRMKKAGYLTATSNPRDKRSKIYQIQERFYDLWLAMGQSRRNRQSLPQTFEFFAIWYDDRVKREQKREELRKNLANQRQPHNALTQLYHLTAIGSEAEQSQTKLELFHQMIHDQRHQDETVINSLSYELAMDHPTSPLMEWARDQTLMLASESGSEEIRRHIEGLIDYWQNQRSGALEHAATVAMQLGGDLSDHGLYQINIELMEDSLKRVKDPETILSSLQSIARSHRILGTVAKAMSTVQRMAEVAANAELKVWTVKTHVERAKVFHSKAEYHASRKEYLRAFNLWTGEQLSVDDDPDFAKVCNRIHTSLSEGDAIDATILEGLAMTLCKLGDPHNALPCAQAAVQMQGKDTLQARRNAASANLSLSVIQWHAQSYSESERSALRAKSILEKEFSLDHPEMARVYSILGCNHSSQGRKEEAEHAFRRALEILPLGHQNLVNSLRNLALSLLESGKYVQAEQEFQRVTVTLKKSDSPPQAQVCQNHRDLAYVLGIQDFQDRSEEEYRKALALYERMPIDKAGMAKVHKDLGICLGKQGKTKQQEEELQRGLALLSDEPSNYRTVRAEIQALLGQALLTQEKMEQAWDHLKKAYSTYAQIFGSKHKSTRQVEAVLQHLLINKPEFRPHLLSEGELDRLLTQATQMGEATRPATIISGDWRELSIAEAAAHLAHAREPSLEIVLKEPELSAIFARTYALSFYPGWELIELWFTRSASKLGAIVFLTDKKTTLILKGTSNLIHAKNADSISLTTDEQALDYLRFYCMMVHGEEGPFRIIENPDFFPADAWPVGKAGRSDQISPPQFTEKDLGPSGGDRRIKATVSYSTSLFIATFKLCSDGRCEMEHDELIVDRMRYSNAFFDNLFYTPGGVLHPLEEKHLGRLMQAVSLFKGQQTSAFREETWQAKAIPESQMLIKDLTSQVREVQEILKEKERQVNFIRTRKLSFAPETELVELWITGKDERSKNLTFLSGHGERCWLNGTPQFLGQYFSESRLQLETDRQVLDFLRFFCGEVSSEGSPFYMIEAATFFDPEEWDGARTEELAKEDIGHITFAEDDPGPGDEDRLIKGWVHHRGRLFQSRFKVSLSGQIEMLTDELVATGFWTRQTVYEGLLKSNTLQE